VGARRAAWLALGLHAIAGAGLLACLPMLPEAEATGALWAVGAPVSAAAIVLARGNRPMRSLIDAGLPAVAALALLVA